MTEQLERQYRHMNKDNWERGPWDDEPDKLHWVDEETELDCLIVRNHFGGLCGYVGVPPEHPAHGVGYDNVEIPGEEYGPLVHGGLTFAGDCNDDGPEESSICHVPFDGRPDNVWWLGFDCGHACDIQPGLEAEMDEVYKKIGEERPTKKSRNDLDEAAGLPMTTYKDINFVRKECERLARQLADMPIEATAEEIKDE